MKTRSSSKFILLVAPLVMATICGAGKAGGEPPAGRLWVPGPSMTKEQLEPGPGEITIDKAVEAARAFFAKVGMPVPAEIPTAERRGVLGGRTAGVGLMYGQEAAVYVNATTGEVTTYGNMRRMSELWRHGAPAGTPLLDNAVSARNYVWSAVRKIGLPESYKLTSLDCRLAYTAVPDAAPIAPSVEAYFEQLPFGYPLENLLGRRDIRIDPADGVVVFYHRQPDTPFAIESHTPVLSLREAGAKAEPILEKYGVGKFGTGAGDLPPATWSSRLAFVHPNGENGGTEYDAGERPLRMRLAWVLYYAGNDAVWIDAADGKVLGGICYGQQGHLSPKAK